MKANTIWAVCAAACLAAGCSLEPAATKGQREQVGKAGRAYAAGEKRTIPDLPAQPDWRDVLHRAFLVNGQLEATYYEWRAAVDRVAPAAAWPNSNLMLGYDYAFMKGGMKGWNATTLTATVDPAMMLSLPVKAETAGKVALAEAQAAGKRFEAAKFTLQQAVLSAWADYALAAEKVRVQGESVALLASVSEIAAQRVRAGGPQQDLLKAQTALELARNDLGNLESDVRQGQAMLNGLLARAPQTPLPPPARLPAPRGLHADDATLIALAVRNNPELAAMAHDVAGRTDALELARLAYLPDFSPQVSVTGNVQQMVGLMVNVPVNDVKIRGGINAADSALRQSRAMTRQTRADRAAQFVATLYALRNHERQTALLQDKILPAAKQTWEASVKAYSAAGISFSELTDTQRMLLQVQVMIAEARMAREKRLAELETLAGLDVETVGNPQKEKSPQVTTRQGKTSGGDTK
ncbi:MAG: TolC family protein [Planctomycetota bacterium]|nr:TolC family protein [Planctomycetota bacterium]